jgi:hypothetical protein
VKRWAWIEARFPLNAERRKPDLAEAEDERIDDPFLFVF